MLITLTAQGKFGEGISCKVDTGRALVEAGLHPATGGAGMLVCSGDMLLEALVACTGVTLSKLWRAGSGSIRLITELAYSAVESRDRSRQVS